MNHFVQRQSRLSVPIKTIQLFVAFLCFLLLLSGGALWVWASVPPEEVATVSSSSSKQLPAVRGKPVSLLVPVRRIEEGERLQKTDFAELTYDGLHVPIDLVRSAQQQEVYGSYATHLLQTQTPFTLEDVSPYPPLSAIKIPSGYRALTISSDRNSLVDGLVRPRSRVDVLWHYTNPRGEAKVRTLVHFVKVLAVNGETDPGVNKRAGVRNTTTLLIEKDDASRIELAQQNGTISLTLYGSEVGINAEPAREAKLSELFAPDDRLEEVREGRMITVDRMSGNLIEWQLQNNRWKRRFIEGKWGESQKADSLGEGTE